LPKAVSFYLPLAQNHQAGFLLEFRFFYCGSCAVIRRQHLDEIGGFATGTVTEDIHTSLRLNKQGYHSVYIPESLAYGVAPAKIEPFLKQRIRWGVGAMNVWRKEGIVTTRGLTVAQRLNYLATALAYFDGWQKAIFYIAPVIVLAFGAMPIDVDGTTFRVLSCPFLLCRGFISGFISTDCMTHSVRKAATGSRCAAWRAGSTPAARPMPIASTSASTTK
jgi:cellulose synthase/poly-beta-1,6-N-acetylglucosamine synthase-like glycosyltransferase